MKRNLGGQLAITLLGLILGLMLAAQFKNVQRVGGSVSLQRTEELTSQIQKLRQDNENLERQISQLERKIWEYERAAKDEGSLYDALYKDLEEARILAGLVDLEGPGVVVTVNNLYVGNEVDGIQVVQNVHYDDLLKLVNELNAAGAEAIAINNERIISTTEIRNAGDYIVINTNRHSVPFEIKAIGNPETLEASLKLLGGVADSLGEILNIKIKTQSKIRIPKYQGPLSYEYAKRVDDGQ